MLQLLCLQHQLNVQYTVEYSLSVYWMIVPYKICSRRARWLDLLLALDSAVTLSNNVTREHSLLAGPQTLHGEGALSSLQAPVLSYWRGISPS